MRIKKAYLESNGCAMTAAEQARLASFLKNNGYVFVKSPKGADVVAYNSCGCCKFHEDFVLKRVRKIQGEMAADSKFIVWGCLPKINPCRLARIFRGISFGPELERFNELFPHKIPIERVRPLFPKNNHYVVKIADGCCGKCAFCAAKLARGPLKSRPMASILSELKQAVARGHTKIELQASDIGCYGRDLRTDLITLLSAIVRVKGTFRVKLGPLCPNFLKPILTDFIPLFRKERFVKILQFDIESGSDKVLRLMERRYSVGDIRHCITRLRAKVPNVSILSNFIVGFPGESEEDFRQSMALVKELNVFPRVFKFEKRPLIRANTMPCPVPPRVINRRYREMSLLTEKVQSLYSRYFKNKKPEMSPSGAWV